MSRVNKKKTARVATVAKECKFTRDNSWMEVNFWSSRQLYDTQIFFVSLSIHNCNNNFVSIVDV